MTVDVKRLLDEAIAILDGVGLSWAVMGGCARNAYAEPRATKDVDLRTIGSCATAETHAFAGTRAHVVSVEDLIVYKVIADRPQDRADIAAVIEAQRLRDEPIDWAYIEEWCDAWDVLPQLVRLRDEPPD